MPYIIFELDPLMLIRHLHAEATLKESVDEESNYSPPWSKKYREVSVNRNTATETQTLKKGQGGRKAGRKPMENDKKPQKPTETQGPRPDLRGFCIKALTVATT